MKSNRIIFAAMALLSALLFALVPGRTTAVLFYGLILVAVLSVLSALLCFFGVRIENQLNTPVIVRGNAGEFELRLINRFPFTMSYLEPVFSNRDKDGNGNRMIFSSPLSKRLSFKYRLTYPHCGNFETGICELRVTDILGLITFKKSVNDRSVISVLPRAFDTEGLPVDVYSESQLPTPVRTKSQIATDIAGVRDYESRDSIKQIHWKLSVKQQKLLSKEFEEERKRQIQMIVSAGGAKSGSPEFDCIADCAASVLRFLLERNCNVRLSCGITLDVHDISELPEAEHILCALPEDPALPEATQATDYGEWVTLIISSRASAYQPDRLAKLASATRVIFVSASGDKSRSEREFMLEQRRLRIECFYSVLEDNRIIFRQPDL